MALSVFRYPGAKNKLLPILSEYLDKILISQSNFVDAFIGGGSVLLYIAEKYPNLNLFCNDKDILISSFWSVISDPDISKLDRLLGLLEQHPTVELFNKLRAEPANDEIDRAYRALFFNRTCFSGILKAQMIGGKSQSSKYTIDCRYNYKKLKEKIIKCRKLLVGRTKVDCKDFSEYHELINTDFPIYVDPPYIKAGNMLYSEYMSKMDHINLSIYLNNRKNWVLSYDDADEVRELYQDYEIVDLSARYCINGEKVSWAKKNELIILS